MKQKLITYNVHSKYLSIMYSAIQKDSITVRESPLSLHFQKMNFTMEKSITKIEQVQRFALEFTVNSESRVEFSYR